MGQGRNNSSRRRARGGGGGRRKKDSRIELHQMEHQGVPLEDVKYTASRTYAGMALHKKLKKNLDALGYESPTEIQDQSFETVANIDDVIGIANTGTGKTGAFLIPIINNLLEDDDVFQTLVILPTRELAQQVEEEFKKLAKGLELFSITLIGGQPLYRDIKKLKKFHHIVVGTPGRLCDLVRQKKLNINHFSILVIDEFDRLLDMGFKEDVFFLANRMKDRDQTLLFSATIEPKQEKLIEELMEDPIELKVSSGTTTAEHITQEIVRTTKDGKFDTLLEMLQKDEFDKVLIFSETKRNVSQLCFRLRKAKIKAEEIHGDRSQDQRKKALARFKEDKSDVLVATDVAARGLDISNVTQVINYQVPQSYDTYIHRIGRTGRAGKAGHAYTFILKEGAKRSKRHGDKDSRDDSPRSERKDFKRKNPKGHKKEFKAKKDSDGATGRQRPKPRKKESSKDRRRRKDD